MADEIQDFIGLAVAKIAEELKTFNGGFKEKIVSEAVAETLTMFCKKSEQFAKVVYKTPRTLSDTCTEVLEGSGNGVADIIVYRNVVKSYFPNADIEFSMDITITGDSPTEDEINREPKKKATAQPPAPKPRIESQNKTTNTPVVKEDKETIHISLF